jgi:hypothetical protein
MPRKTANAKGKTAKKNPGLCRSQTNESKLAGRPVRCPPNAGVGIHGAHGVTRPAQKVCQLHNPGKIVRPKEKTRSESPLRALQNPKSF